MAFLNRVDDDFVGVDVPADGGPITMEFGELPDGYEVIYNEAQPADGTAFVTTFIDPLGNPEGLEMIVVASIEPVMIGRDATEVDVNGTSAWLSTDGAHTQITWQVDPSTFAYVYANAPETPTLQVARSLRWMPVDEWAQHYEVDINAIEPGVPMSF